MQSYNRWTNDALFWEYHGLRRTQDVLEALEAEDEETDKCLQKIIEEIEERKALGKWTEPQWGSYDTPTQFQAAFLVGSDRMKSDPREMLKHAMRDSFERTAGYVPQKVDQENLRTDPKLLYILYYNTANATREDIAKLRALRSYTTSQLRSTMINKSLEQMRREGQQYITINGQKLRLIPSYLNDE